MRDKLKTKQLLQIRVISGKWRGRKIILKNENNLRPTTNKTKETLFNWLTPVIQNANCLDCYAGSGSLGFEALSRFAKQTTFIELNKNNVQYLIKNKIQLQANNATVIKGSIFTVLNKINDIFNVVFIDPPFYKNLLYKSIQFLEKKQCLSDKSFIYIESEIDLILKNIPINWHLYRERVTGRVVFRLFIRYQT
ncbi:Ribosomal RNA small subunit methyltransferase D [Candidatus Providencia siddallii]|uniref:Ribosomal RNA small subunit methyltransferase D n=1 Tax=Candidatus Providencia siddallii TaxID=1715285 RepID=A0A0M6W780_9GAMM|nr:Ribosomal RNA small subunit methyltransferase D [Candidatus Providencia siddallii]